MGKSSWVPGFQFGKALYISIKTLPYLFYSGFFVERDWHKRPESLATVQPFQRALEIGERALKLCFKCLIKQRAKLPAWFHAPRN
jgi:hypothetical protein